MPEHLIDFGFTQSDPWSDQFAWLGYDSSNYVELMGSLLVILLLILIQGLLTLCFSVCNIRTRSKKIRSCFSSLAFKQALMRFFQEALIEHVICSSVGFKLLEFKDFWNTAD